MRGVDVGMSNSAEFHIQNEDFPALPGSVIDSNASESSLIAAAQLQQQSSVISGAQLIGTPPPGMAPSQSSLEAAAAQAAAVSQQLQHHHQQQQLHHHRQLEQRTSGIQTLPTGEVIGIPASMLADQYGLAGLVTYLRAVDKPTVVSLALGTDLTTLGLNLNLAERRQLYTTFGGPWADFPCRTQDLDCKVPDEYLTNSTIRDKLPSIKLNKLCEDVLFFLFYNCPGEVYQIAAASELYSRDWRFHKTEGVWLTRSQYGGVKEQCATFERGSYHVFDPVQWRKIPRDMKLEYKDLEDRPKLPSGAQQQAQAQQQQQGGGGAGNAGGAQGGQSQVAPPSLAPSSNGTPAPSSGAATPT